jgi:transcriptional regulator with XRE-family HTH domain
MSTTANLLAMTFGDRLRLARRATRLTQEAAANALGVSKASISAWENNKSLPGLPQFANLCQLYAANAAALIGKDGITRVSEMTEAGQVDRKPRMGRPALSTLSIQEEGTTYAVPIEVNKQEAAIIRRLRALPEEKQAAILTLLPEEK